MLVPLALASIVALVVLPVWPGVFTVDSQVMFESAAHDSISDQYSPLLQWIWGVTTDLGFGPWTALVAGVALCVIGLYGVYSLQLGRWPSVLATLLTVLFPAVYGFLGWVGRDIWFAGLLLCALALVGRLQQGHRKAAVAGALIVVSILAADARQNGLPVLVIGVGLGVYFLLGSRSRKQAIVGAVIAGLVAAPLLLKGGQDLVVSQDFQPQQPLLYQDLLAVSLRLDESQLSRDVFPSQDLAEVRKSWQPGNVGATIFPPGSPVRFSMGPDGAEITDELTADWKRMVREHPITYLGQRLRLQKLVLGLNGSTSYPYFESSAALGTQSPRLLQDLSGLNDVRTGYLDAAGVDLPTSGFPYLPWIYLLFGVGAGVLIALRSDRLRLFAVVAVALQVSLQALLTFTVIGAEFRFEAFQVILGIVLPVTLGSLLLAERRQQALPDSREQPGVV